MVKSVCPNIEEELSYKPWSDTVKARVDRWIKIVLAGNDPEDEKSYEDIPSDIKKEENDEVQKAEVKVDTAAPAPVEDNTDDLPF